MENCSLKAPHSAPRTSEALGEFTKLVGLYDLTGLLPRIEGQAQNTPRSLLRESARLAMIHSFEDFCRAKNAFLSGDDLVLKDTIHNVTHPAANAVVAINETGFTSDREIKAYRKFGKLPKQYGAIEALRYGNLSTAEQFKTLMRFYANLVMFCRKGGISFPVEPKVLESLR